jgi:hypothetical protein
MIEDTLQKLAASIDALTAVIARQNTTTTTTSAGSGTHTVMLDEVRITGLERTKVPAAVETPTPKAEKKPKAEKPKVEEPKVEEPKVEEPKSGATLADLRDAAQKCLDGGKLVAVVAINKEYGLKRISEAPEAKYGEIVAKLTKALADES